MRASVLRRNHAGRGGVGVPIGFLPVDAPVAQGLDRNFPAGDGADDIIARRNDVDVGIEIAKAGFTGGLAGSCKHEESMPETRPEEKSSLHKVSALFRGTNMVHTIQMRRPGALPKTPL